MLWLARKRSCHENPLPSRYLKGHGPKIINPALDDEVSRWQSRTPQIGDTGTIVYAYDVTSFAVECVNTDGLTDWLADFFAEELEFLGKQNVKAGATERD